MVLVSVFVNYNNPGPDCIMSFKILSLYANEDLWGRCWFWGVVLCVCLTDDAAVFALEGGAGAGDAPQAGRPLLLFKVEQGLSVHGGRRAAGQSGTWTDSWFTGHCRETRWC